MTVILLAGSYPYDLLMEQSFLTEEVRHLSRVARLILVPIRRGGRRLPVPEGVEVDETFAETVRIGEPTGDVVGVLRRLVVSRLLPAEVFRAPRLLGQPAALRALVGAADRAELGRRWVGRFFERAGVAPKECVFYTYWCGVASLAVALARQDYPDLRLVSRAHGHDLYEERNPYGYIPARPRVLRGLDLLLPDSDCGSEYIANRYPWFASRCRTSRLGVPDPGFVSQPSTARAVSVMSCSLFDPVKRIDLILRSIEHAATQRPDLIFEWHHFGTGELKTLIEQQATNLPRNVTARFPGFPGRQDLLAFYRDHPVDIFVNLSSSEGTSVAMMEAASCGVQFLATAVGGTPEIVSSRNGALVSPSPTPQEVAGALLGLVADRAAAAARGRESRLVWRERYSSELNYPAFGELLQQVRLRESERAA